MSSAAPSLIDRIIRDDVRAMGAYHVPDSHGLVKLDAMENPYRLPPALREELGKRLSEVALNRYPVPTSEALRAKLKSVMQVPVGMEVLLGNGSDELISIIAMAAAKPGAKVLAPVPGFVMYAMSAQFAGLEFVGVPLREDFSLDRARMLRKMAEEQPAIIYLAYPNNPTGNLFDAEDMEVIVRAANGDVCNSLVVVDEAYQPFAQDSWMPRLADFDNLLVMRTVSKLGLAGIRLGYMAGAPAWIEQFDKVRPPYNINVLTEATALFALEHVDVLDEQAAQLREQRSALAAQLAAQPGVTVFPSDANFLLIRVPDAAQTFERLVSRKVLIKNVSKMHALLANCLRVTVSTPEENAQFMEAFVASLQD
ncbi:histidinol-phosphate transaminase [Cupriavidus plantarum]|uniref:histidinol-phosphate transaminase n=1 Tax=Cupriavidus plantarum TaxID=942865 RepID=UPI001B2A820B|nr:histidinol-phosphate transaminase [Cupriavidus plantarum]CAG2154066.1 Histidinol-phosphate aminotransferase 2 [Cupriavidus plantarum]SMR86412.1 histidinol phosphate aminotransferase apoenzyme [Cupriavidus plantarum]